jgi:folate-binding protein YgfZ
MSTRSVLRLTGSANDSFLKGLVTRDVTDSGFSYSALLTPQGKFIADFFLQRDGADILIDVATTHTPALAQRLTMYRLRADVQIVETDLIVSRGTGTAPEGAHPDPRHDAMGWRLISNTDCSDDTNWDALRVTHMIPETGVELTPDTYVLEAGFERLNGIDFRKGCYVGQEIAARMKHKTELRKGLAQLAIAGSASIGTEITADGRAVGTLFTQSGGLALAHLRYDRAEMALKAGDASLTLTKKGP